jgi:hypothetical protein
MIADAVANDLPDYRRLPVSKLMSAGASCKQHGFGNRITSCRCGIGADDQRRGQSAYGRSHRQWHEQTVSGLPDFNAWVMSVGAMA